MEQDICTTVEQSKRLLELGLDKSTADMGWNIFSDKSTRLLPIADWDLVKDGEYGVKTVPAWSLGRLLRIMPYRGQYAPSVYKFDGMYFCSYLNEDSVCEIEFHSKDSEVEPAYQMLCWLLENMDMEEMIIREYGCRINKMEE